MSVGGVLAVNAVVLLAAMTALWGVSVAVRDASIVDIAWGASFVVVAWVSRFVADGHAARQNLLVVLTTLWGLRLAIYLARRNLGQGEDPRYVSMRRRGGDAWWWVSLFKVFWLQGALVWVVSLPVQLGQVPDEAGWFWVMALLGTALWAVGLGFETVGDLQLARFKADPANDGQIMDQGLWRYTRHPNYFGDACVWWGLGIAAASTWLGAIGLVGPLVMTYLLVNVSGKALLERRMAKARPGYADYVARTSGFWPRPPRTEVRP